MSIHVYLSDPQSGITVESPVTEAQNNKWVYTEWPLEDAVKLLVNKVAEKTGKHPSEIMFASPPFKIIAKWESDA